MQLLTPPPPQVQRGVQVPAERAEGPVPAAALLGAADAEETSQVHPDGRGEVAPEEPHGLSDRQPAVLFTGEDTDADQGHRSRRKLFFISSEPASSLYFL